MDLQKTYAEISLSALSHNLAAVRGAARCREIMAVVKADAYGHGAVAVSRYLLKNGITMLGVAFLQEAVDLRSAGIQAPILIFFDTDHIEACLTHQITPTVYDLQTAKQVSTAASRLNLTVPLHIKIDTGMGRVGMRFDDAFETVPRIARLDNIRIEGLMSHLSDSDLQDKAFALQQLQHFGRLAEALRARGMRLRYLHIANSAAVMSLPQSHLDMVRPGIMLYGYGPEGYSNLEPVLSLKSRVLFLKTVPSGTPVSYERTFVTKKRSRIATVPVGYADGYCRRMSNAGEVIINRQRAPVVGRVCMDTIMVDVTGIPDVRRGTEVVLIGKQGKEQISAADIARKTGTIPYEVLTSIGSRVTRHYI